MIHRLRSPTTSLCYALLGVVLATGCGARSGSEAGVVKEAPATATDSDLTPELANFLPPSKQARGRPDVAPQFTEVAQAVGIEFTFFSDIVPDRYLLPEIMGGGATWFDFDNDGRFDLYLMNGCPLDPSDRELPGDGSSTPATATPMNRLYRNLGNGRFEELSQQASTGDTHYGQGVARGDFDADGFCDLYLANYGVNRLLRNNGDGTFSDVTDQSGTGDPAWSTSPIWLDLDGDDDLDLFVTNYLDVTLQNSQVCKYNNVVGYCGPGSYEAAPDRVYLNQGDGTFVESARRLGLVAPGGKGLAIAALDFDHDLRPEIYVANDMMENFLFRRETKRPDGAPGGGGDPSSADATAEGIRYTDVAVQAGCAVSLSGLHEASMGVACADFDGDQRPDIFVTHYYANKNTLYRNLGDLSFHDDSRRTRIAATSYETLGFGTVPFDYDQDGATDLFITNGHVLGANHKPNKMPPQLLHNDGQGRFADISRFGGAYFRELWLGRGAAGGDFDNDGDLDIGVTHISQPFALLRNDTQTGHHWLGIALQTRSRLPPVGGRVVVQAGTDRQTRPIVAGGSYLCDGDPRLLFGLGDHGGSVSVEVHWPSGQVDIHAGLEVDRYWHLSEHRTPQPASDG